MPGDLWLASLTEMVRSCAMRDSKLRWKGAWQRHSRTCFWLPHLQARVSTPTPTPTHAYIEHHNTRTHTHDVRVVFFTQIHSNINVPPYLPLISTLLSHLSLAWSPSCYVCLFPFLYVSISLCLALWLDFLLSCLGINQYACSPCNISVSVQRKKDTLS